MTSVISTRRKSYQMGTIIARKRKDGTTSHTAQIIIRSKGKTIHQEAKTFDRQQAAKAWLARRETELRANGPAQATIAASLADVIDRFTQDTVRAVGRTKAQCLRTIKTYALADMTCSEITSADIVAFAQEIGKTASPATVANYLSHLAAVFAIARPAWGYPLDPLTMTEAQTVSKRLGITGKSKRRDRRPTLDELDRLLTMFERRADLRSDSIPMHRLVAFALFSTRRQEEICRVEWADLDETHSRIMVRDMKHPGQKLGNDVWIDLPPEALAIIQAMPRRDSRIFPFAPDSVSTNFTRACHLLGIEDLHFHDLRHEGVSRLFELGWNIPHVAAVSGHRSWQSLQRYTHIRQSGDKYQGWPWLEIVTQPPPEPIRLQPPRRPQHDPCSGAT